MRYVEETGTVVAVSRQEASVRLDRKRDKSCGACCACSAFTGADQTVRVPRGDFQEGDRVRVRIPQVNAYLSMLLIFAMPIALFAAGLMVGRALEGTDRIGTGALVGGLVGLGVSFALAWVINRALRGKAAPEAHRLTGAL